MWSCSFMWFPPQMQARKHLFSWISFYKFVYHLTPGLRLVSPEWGRLQSQCIRNLPVIHMCLSFHWENSAYPEGQIISLYVLIFVWNRCLHIFCGTYYLKKRKVRRNLLNWSEFLSWNKLFQSKDRRHSRLLQ